MSCELVTVRLPRDHWTSIRAAMSWDLAEPGNNDAAESAKRAHASRCFEASAAIAVALGHKPTYARLA